VGNVVPGTEKKGKPQDAGAYLRDLAAADGPGFADELEAIADEVRSLQQQKAEAEAHKRTLRSQLVQMEAELTQTMSARLAEMEAGDAQSADLQELAWLKETNADLNERVQQQIGEIYELKQEIPKAVPFKVHDSTYSRTVCRPYGGAKGLVMWY
jgi:DNA repair exonuclease SbcCD ATPase subunit